ncbi:MAG: tetratricopeptide repeat protein [Phycisphaerae bacterium]|jgi:tetratricopeptide (TPR) repeat protein
MRTLAPFVLVCAVLAGLAIWLLAGSFAATPKGQRAAPRAPGPPSGARIGAARRPESPISDDTVAGEASVTSARLPADASPAGAIRSETPADSVPPESSHDPVRWPQDERKREKREQYLALRAEIDADSANELALREALAAALELEWWDEAREVSARIAALRPDDADTWFEYGTLLMRVQRWVEAIEPLGRAAELSPQNARAWFNLAVAHQRLGHLLEALRAWDRCAELSSDDAEVLARRAETLLDLCDWNRASADLRRALELDPAQDDARLNLSLALLRLGRFDEASGACEALLARRPRHVPALNRLAQIAWERHEATPGLSVDLLAEVAQRCEQSLAIDAGQPEAQALLERAREALARARP